MTSSPAHVSTTTEDAETVGDTTVTHEAVAAEADETSDTADDTTTFAPPAPPKIVADAVLNAGFVKLVVYPSGDCVAAAIMLRKALTQLETPYHITTARTPREAAQAAAATDSRTTLLSIGVDLPHVDRPDPTWLGRETEADGAEDETEDDAESGADTEAETNDGRDESADGTANPEGEGAAPIDENGEHDAENGERPEADSPVEAVTETDEGNEGDGAAEANEDTPSANEDAEDADADADGMVDEPESTPDEETDEVVPTTETVASEGNDTTTAPTACEPTHTAHGDESEVAASAVQAAPTEAMMERSDAVTMAEAEAVTIASEAASADAADDTPEIRDAERADPHRELHSAERGVRMAMEPIDRTAVGTEPEPVPVDDKADENGEGEVVWPFDGLSWRRARHRAGVAHRTDSVRRPPDGTGAAPDRGGSGTSDRVPSRREVAAVAGTESPTDDSDPEGTGEDTDEATVPGQGDDTDDTDEDDMVSEDGDTGDTEKIGAAQFISDGGVTTTPSVGPGAFVHVGTHLHEADLRGHASEEVPGNISAGVSASVHLATAVASLADRREGVSPADPVYALAGMLTHGGGRNATFDLDDTSTWPTRYGARTCCERARKAGITSEMGLGTPLTSTPSAIQSTTFAHGDFSGDASGLGRIMQSCPVVDVFPDDDAADEWDNFVESFGNIVQPNWVGQADSNEREILGPNTRTSSPRFTRSMPPLVDLFLGCHRLPSDEYALPTVEGYADLFDTLARTGHSTRLITMGPLSDGGDEDDDGERESDDLVDRWREMSGRVHSLVREAEEHDGDALPEETTAYVIEADDDSPLSTLPVEQVAILLD